MKKFKIIEGLPFAQTIALLLLRWATAIVFLFHGYPKLAHAQQWSKAFVQMGFPSYFAYISGLLETIGAAFLIVGLAIRVSAALLAVEMAIAFLKVDLPFGPIGQVDNYQLSLLLVVCTFTLASFGPGKLSLDHVISAARGKSTASSLSQEREPGIP